MEKTVGIVGLGLIGGSLAKAYKRAGWTVFGEDKDTSIVDYAMLQNVVDAPLDEQTLADCCLIHLAVIPSAAIGWMKQHAPSIPKDCLLADDCGTKVHVCQEGFELAKANGFTYVGCHPMAGTHHSGFAWSKADMFCGAPMVVVPPTRDDLNLLEHICDMLAPLELGRVVFAHADEHDRVIAFTSQLAHVVSNAYVKSPTSQQHFGFSAGSYQDLTRVAWLNEQMWTELFLDNRENLLREIRSLEASLEEYAVALEENDSETLCRLLREGRLAKEATMKQEVLKK
ncbi:MAG: prephenate dehydrogenase [Bacteroidaceae bacterium]|nr:prephenate dehydrogenase [Bacteroidaceae bacterium]